MSFKTITVFVDGTASGDARLDAACALAQRLGAHLTAVACTRQIDVGVYAMPGAEMAVDFAAIDDSRQRAEAMARKTAERMERNGVTGDTRWASSVSAGLEESAARAGRHSDLTIVGPLMIDGQEGEVADAVLEGVLFGSGRPVLMLPAGWSGDVGTNVMVAWDGSRVSSRAIADATPFLEAAGRVTVALVDPEPGVNGIGENPGADIAQVIARHGAKVEVQILARAGASVAERLQTTASDMGADLMVMGGYGTSRWREAIFSGVSRQVLENPSAPVLVSH